MPLRSSRSPRPEDLHFATLHSDGRALRYHFDEFAIDLIPRLIERLEISELIKVISIELPSEEVRMYLGQSLYLELLDAARTVFRYRYLAENGHFHAGKIWCPRGLETALAPELKMLPGVSLVMQSSLNCYLRRFWRRHDFQFPWRTSNRTVAKMEGPCIAVELVEGVDLDGKSDAFWLSSGLVEPAQVLFVLEPHNASFVVPKKQFELINSMGARVVAVGSNVSARGLIPVWKPPSLPKWAVRLKKAINSQRDDSNYWLSRALIDCIERVAFWEAFYQEHRVAISQNFTELTTETMAKRIAISRVGGIEMGKMRSEFFDRSGTAFHFKHEIAFVWHRNVFPMLQYSNTNVRHVLESGYVYDYLFDRRRDAAAVLRKDLESRGVSKVIAVFDNSTHLNSHSSAQQYEAFYHCLAALVTENPHLGIILKPKKQLLRARYLRAQRWANWLGLGWLSRRYPLEIPDLDPALTLMRNTGRCIELSGIKANVIDAGLAADVVVGIPCSTAACEASLAGKALVMYDPSGAHGNPICNATSRVSFPTIPEFLHRLNTHLKSTGQEEVTNGPLALLDPLQDGYAASRVGAFISDFLSAFRKSYGKDECLKHAFKGFVGQGGSVLPPI